MNIDALLSRMTLRQKLAQMTQLDYTFFAPEEGGEITGPLHRMGIREEDVDCCGSVLNITGAALTRRVQEEHLKKDPNRIPLLFMRDVIHGFRTIFPIPLALGCSWNPALMRQSARVAAREAAAAGVHVTFSPMADLVRDARWGRVMEATGEDPWLNALYARAMVEGYQGADLRENDTLAACVKHLAAYGAAEAGRDYHSVELGSYSLREFYLPAYKAAIDAGAAMGMAAFHALNGTPCSANAPLLRGTVREEWGFDGVLISDWGAVHELIPHGIAENGSEAARLALQAGVDIEMMTADYLTCGEEMVRRGQMEEARINEAVRRILTLKEKLGLFDDPFRGTDAEKETRLLACASHRASAREAAVQSLVLLKNSRGILPLRQEQKIAVIGPYAETTALLGGWSCIGWEGEVVTLRQGIEQKAGENAAFAGCGVRPGRTEIEKAVRAAEKAEIVVMALGEAADMSGEAASRAFLDLPEEQEELARAIFSLHKPTAVLLFGGRPLDLRWLSEQADALLEAWFPGTEGGPAIADVLYGDRMPEGRLVMSFPYTVGQAPLFYNSFSSGRPHTVNPDEKFTSRYLDAPNEPLYPFGYGLGYSPVSYGDLQLSGDCLRPGKVLQAEITVTNAGDRYPVTETVQLYIRDVAGSLVRPLRELKGFRKVTLQPGETRRVTLEIREEMLRFYHEDGAWYAEPGLFEVYMGSDSQAERTASFRLETDENRP